MPVIYHESFAHYSVTNGNIEMKTEFPAAGRNVSLIAGGGFDGASEARLGSTNVNSNQNSASFLVRKFPDDIDRAVFSFDARFSSIGSQAFDPQGGGFFSILDADWIDSEIERVNSNANSSVWSKGVILSQSSGRKLTAFVRSGSGSTVNMVIAVSDNPVYTGNDARIYNHEVILDLSSTTTMLKVRVDGLEVINATFDRDAVNSVYRVTRIGGCGWSSNNHQGAVTNLSNVVVYTEDADLIYPAGPLNLTTIETGLSALDSHPANPGTYDVIPIAGKVYAMNDVGPSIPAGAPILAAWMEARMAAANGGQAEAIALDVLDSAGVVLSTRNAYLTPGLPDQILVTDVSSQIGDIAAVNGAQARIRRAP